jgi:DMSO/TMAO reductase YedYZ heme-binding membrane subunit
MNRRPSVAFWVETALAAISGFLLLLTLVWRDWIEGVFGVDPDRHNGSLEWLLVAVLLLVTLAFSAMARGHWQRSRALARSASGS